MGCVNCGDYSLRIEIYGMQPDDPLPRCVRQLQNMAAAGQLELLMKSLAYPHDQWFRVCSLEEDLLHDSDRHAGYSDWNIVMGEVLMMDGITGWMEYTDAHEDCIIVPYPWEIQDELADDVAVFTREEWINHFYPTVHAIAPVSEESGMVLNRARHEVATLEELLELRS